MLDGIAAGRRLAAPRIRSSPNHWYQARDAGEEKATTEVTLDVDNLLDRLNLFWSFGGRIIHTACIFVARPPICKSRSHLSVVAGEHCAKDAPRGHAAALTASLPSANERWRTSVGDRASGRSGRRYHSRRRGRGRPR